MTEKTETETNKTPDEIVAEAVKVQKGLVQDTTEVLNDLRILFRKEAQKAFDEEFSKLRDEYKLILRKGLGLEPNKPVYQGELVSAVRKILLEEAETQKKTPAPIEKAGPEGNKPKDAIDKLLKEYGVTA